MRCTLMGFVVDRRMASSTTGPIVMLGTNRPSITSTWTQSAPAASTARTSSPSRVKSAANTDGATMIGGVGAGILALSTGGDDVVCNVMTIAQRPGRALV